MEVKSNGTYRKRGRELERYMCLCIYTVDSNLLWGQGIQGFIEKGR